MEATAVIGVSLGVVVLAEAAALWYLWSRYRRLQDDAAVANGLATGLQAQLVSAYNDLSAARAALAKQNDLEAKTDAKTIAAHPDLDDALARLNGL